eukprot:1147822-Pelagomonas_calceolata.AAC.1
MPHTEFTLAKSILSLHVPAGSFRARSYDASLFLSSSWDTPYIQFRMLLRVQGDGLPSQNWVSYKPPQTVELITMLCGVGGDWHTTYLMTV